MSKTVSYRLPASVRYELEYLRERELRPASQVIQLAVEQWVRADRPEVETRGPGGAPATFRLPPRVVDLIERSGGTRTAVVAQAVAYRAKQSREDPTTLLPRGVSP